MFVATRRVAVPVAVRSIILIFLAALIAAISTRCGNSHSHCIRDSDCGSGLQCEVSKQVCVQSSNAFALVTDSLQQGVVDQPYEQTLDVRGGRPPYLWSVNDRSDPLQWLQLDANRGVLSGIPPRAISPAASLTIRVDDSIGQSTRKTFALSIRTCNDNEVYPCHAAVSNACYVGLHVCRAASFGPCEIGVPSADVAHCGPNCDSCGGSSDSCPNGVCRCGSSAPCSGTTNSCCAIDGRVGCVDVRTNADACGACDTSCDRDRAHVIRACADGVCQYPCAAGWGRCPPTSRGCETDFTSTDNCGACGNRCPPPRGAPGSGRAVCNRGHCEMTCSAGYHLCGDTCYGNDDPSHCGPSCIPCTPAIDGYATCYGGTCGQSCPGTRPNLCGGRCYPNEVAHCGGCEACIPPSGGDVSCPEGTCLPDCHGLTLCGSACVSTQTDIHHCGGCGIECPAPIGGHAICSLGQCYVQCPSGQAPCSGICVDIWHDPSHCGACGRVCPFEQPYCILGECVSCTDPPCPG